MADCTYMETAFSHFIPELAGSFLSTAIVAVGLFCFDWRMALAALWVLPVSFAVVLLSAGAQDKLYAKSSAAKLALADGIQEFIETVRDLKSNNAEDTYLAGLDRKIDEVEKAMYALLTLPGTWGLANRVSAMQSKFYKMAVF